MQSKPAIRLVGNYRKFYSGTFRQRLMMIYIPDKVDISRELKLFCCCCRFLILSGSNKCICWPPTPGNENPFQTGQGFFTDLYNFPHLASRHFDLLFPFCLYWTAKASIFYLPPFFSSFLLSFFLLFQSFCFALACFLMARQPFPGYLLPNSVVFDKKKFTYKFGLYESKQDGQRFGLH